ncbi:MAG TPA: hypothetical protein VGY57_08025, partial [Vicinamibacterales bacterium]|nr:hypothetical protein [Vicinamibacterales bacterium]
GPSGDMTGEASMTLKAITSDSSARSATFDSKFTARMASPAGAAPVMFDIRFDGGGTMVFDLDRGVATMTDQQGTVDGSMSMGSAMPQMKVRGTIKSSSQSTY